MLSVTTDNVDGAQIISDQDGLVAVQFRNNTASNIYVVSEKTQSFADRGVIVKPNEQWPVAGPSLWAGNLWVYTDSPTKITFGMIKSNTLSTVQRRGGFF